jgi:hypothetical protein
MPSGENNKVWYSELIDYLKKNWSHSIKWEEYRELCHTLTAMLHAIKKERGIIEKTHYLCRKCNTYHIVESTSISVRSVLFTLAAVGKINESELKQLDMAWKKYRKKHQLLSCGSEAK